MPLETRPAAQPGTARGGGAANGRSALGTAAAQAAAALPHLTPTRYGGARQAGRDDQALPLLSGGALSPAGSPGSAHLEVEGESRPALAQPLLSWGAPDRCCWVCF